METLTNTAVCHERPQIIRFMTITIVENLEATMNLAMHTTVEVTAPEVLEVAKMAMVEAAGVVAAVEEGEQPICNNTFFTLPYI